jgi:hypothetical protein
MEFLKKYGGWILAVVVIIILLFSLKECNNVRNESKQNLLLLQDAKDGGEGFRKQISRLGDTLNIQTQRIISSKEQIEALGLSAELKDDQIKTLQSRVAIRESVGFKKDKVLIPYVPGKNSVVFTRDSANHEDTLDNGCPNFPLEFAQDQQWDTIHGEVTERGIEFTRLQFLTSPTVTLGFKRATTFKQFFSRPEPVVVVTDKSPYATVTGMQNVVYKEPAKWYQTTGFKVGAGGVVGVILTTVLYSVLHK